MAPQPSGTRSRGRPSIWMWVAIGSLLLNVALGGFLLIKGNSSPLPARPPAAASSSPSAHRSAPSVRSAFNQVNIASSTDEILHGTDNGPVGVMPKFMNIRFDADLFRFTYPQFNLTGSAFEQALNYAASKGNGVLAIADDYAPQQVAEHQSNGVSCGNALCALQNSQPAASAYARFAVQVALACMRVHPHCVGIELGNEPNQGVRWGPYPNPAAYARAVSLACPAIKSATRGAIPVVLGGLANIGTDATDFSPADFYTQVVRWFDQRHLPHCWDAVGMHPYGDPNLQATQTLYQAMRRAHDGGKKIWATEVGTGGSPAQAASYFRAFVYRWFDHPWAGPLYWFSWSTNSGQTGIDSTPQLMGVFMKTAYSFNGQG